MSRQVPQLNGNHKKRVLVLRMGGLGDCLILTTVCKQLHKLGYSVHYYMGSPTGKVHKLFDGLEYIEKSTEVLNSLGGVPVFNRPTSKPYSFKDCVKPTAAGSPALPEV